MHIWLAEQLDEMLDTDSQNRAGKKLNLLAPRGSANRRSSRSPSSLRAAVEGREPYIWIVSDTRHQAIAHLENLKDELADNDETSLLQSARVN